MRVIQFIVLAFIIQGCNFSIHEKKQVNNPDYKNTDTIREFSQWLEQGNEVELNTVYLADRIYDSINSKSSNTRNYYFKVSMLLLNRGTAMMASHFNKNLLQYI